LSEVELTLVRRDREPFLPLLLEADGSERVLRSYMNDGDLFEIRAEGRSVGICLLLEEGDSVEIKNIALEEGSRGRGIGRLAIRAAADVARERGARRLVVGTADTAEGTIAFYRRVGFRDDGIRPGFFDAYPEPMVVDGRTTHDMVMFAMDLETDS
jgi:ribosomal protein S18 acetylase RimI-like enzyme